MFLGLLPSSYLGSGLWLYSDLSKAPLDRIRPKHGRITTSDARMKMPSIRLERRRETRSPSTPRSCSIQRKDGGQRLFTSIAPSPPLGGVTPDAYKEFEERWEKIDKMFASDDFPKYREEPSYLSKREEEPDLSGLYYQRTIVGPNAGNWSIQFISGP